MTLRTKIASAFALAGVLAFAASHETIVRVSAQPTTTTLRPKNSADVSGINSPQNAYDDIGDVSNASGVITRSCRNHCTTAGTLTARWYGVANGYHPIRLEVHWRAFALWPQLYGSATSLVNAKLEYSLNGGASWDTAWDGETADYTWTFTSPSCSNHGITCGDHVSILALGDYQKTEDIQVRATLTAQLPQCNNCTTDASNNGGGIYVWDIRVIADNCRTPLSESGWDSAEQTLQKYSMTLTPPSGVTFSGRHVAEEDPQDGFGHDYCYFTGSAVPEWTGITSGDWLVNSDNTYGIDYLGWFEWAVNFYQQYAVSLPCGTIFHQRMTISCGSLSNPYVPYILNTMEYTIGADYVGAQRQSAYAERSWP